MWKIFKSHLEGSALLKRVGFIPTKNTPSFLTLIHPGTDIALLQDEGRFLRSFGRLLLPSALGFLSFSHVEVVMRLRLFAPDHASAPLTMSLSSLQLSRFLMLSLCVIAFSSAVHTLSSLRFPSCERRFENSHVQKTIASCKSSPLHSCVQPTLPDWGSVSPSISLLTLRPVLIASVPWSDVWLPLYGFFVDYLRLLEYMLFLCGE